MEASPSTVTEPSSGGGRRALGRAVARWMRWLHLYLSLVSFAVVLFFSVTGITLNHPDWFGADKEQLREHHGQVPLDWVRQDAPNGVARLEVVEHLRQDQGVRGTLDHFTVDDLQCSIAFRAPAYTADVFLDRETGEYDLTVSYFGMVALLNDLHKGRDSGKSWMWVIDLSALFLVLVSFTGLSLIFWMKRHRAPGLIAALVGLLLIGLVYWLGVPR